MKTDTYNPKALERFLLGDLPEKERTQLEDAFLVDPDLFDQLSEVEHDLIDEYVEGNLRGRDLALFEKHYLNLPRSRKRVALARELGRTRAAEREIALAAQTSRTVVAEKKSSLFSAFWRSWGPVLSFSSAAILLAAVIGVGYLAFRNRESNTSNQIARNEPQITPETSQPGGNPGPSTPATSETPAPQAPAESRNEIRQSEQPRNANSRPAPQAPPAPAPPSRSLTLALMAGIARGEDQSGNTLKLSPDVSTVNLQVNFNRPELKGFRARIETIEGRRVFSGNIKGVGPSQKQQRGLFSVPARSIPPGDYIVTISGTDASGATSDVEDYYLSVKKDQ